jgi:hypothetical protein
VTGADGADLGAGAVGVHGNDVALVDELPGADAKIEIRRARADPDGLLTITRNGGLRISFIMPSAMSTFALLEPPWSPRS